MFETALIEISSDGDLVAWCFCLTDNNTKPTKVVLFCVVGCVVAIRANMHGSSSVIDLQNSGTVQTWFGGEGVVLHWTHNTFIAL